MKNIILNFVGNNDRKTKKIKIKQSIISNFEKESENICKIEDDDIKIISDIIAKNRKYISDMCVIIIGNNNFNTSKIRYKKILEMSGEEALLNLCDEEINNKNTEIESLKERIKALEQENSTLKTKLDCLKHNLNNTNDNNQNNNEKKEIIFEVDKEIKELYPNEIKTIIIKTLENYSKTINSDRSRKKDILSSIVQSNKNYKNFDNFFNTFINCLNEDGSLSERGENELLKYGFDISRKSNHHTKIQLSNGKYTVIIGSTLSDKRSKDNIVSIFRNVFLCV